jgi:hypothetical protein
MKIAGAIGVDRKPRQRKTLADRIAEQDHVIKRLEAKLASAEARRAWMLDEASSKAKAALAEVEKASHG